MSDNTIPLPNSPIYKVREAYNELNKIDSLLYGVTAEDIKTVQLRIREVMTTLNESQDIMYQWQQTMFTIANKIY